MWRYEELYGWLFSAKSLWHIRVNQMSQKRPSFQRAGPHTLGYITSPSISVLNRALIFFWNSRPKALIHLPRDACFPLYFSPLIIIFYDFILYFAIFINPLERSTLIFITHLFSRNWHNRIIIPRIIYRSKDLYNSPDKWKLIVTIFTTYTSLSCNSS